MTKTNRKGRRRARVFVMQALYQWHMTNNTLAAIEREFRVENDGLNADWQYFSEVLSGIGHELSAIDDAIKASIRDDFTAINLVELSVLRLGIYELMFRIDVPCNVVVSEGVELAKQYGASEGHKFVNAVLDKQANQLRQLERPAADKSS